MRKTKRKREKIRKENQNNLSCALVIKEEKFRENGKCLGENSQGNMYSYYSSNIHALIFSIILDFQRMYISIVGSPFVPCYLFQIC